MDFSVLEIVLGCLCVLFLAVAAGTVLVVNKGIKEEIVVAEHKWAANMASALAALGISPTVTNPLSDLAVGAVPEAIGAGVAAAKYLDQRDNRLKEGLNVFKTIAASHPAEVKQFLQDYLAGASDSQLFSDLQATFKGVPALPTGPILQHLEQVSQVLDSIGTHGDLKSVASLITSNPVLAPIAGAIMRVASNLHAMGAASATDAAKPADTVPAPTAPNTAASIVPDGHLLMVAPPGTTIPQVAVPAAT